MVECNHFFILLSSSSEVIDEDEVRDVERLRKGTAVKNRPMSHIGKLNHVVVYRPCNTNHSSNRPVLALLKVLKNS